MKKNLLMLLILVVLTACSNMDKKNKITEYGNLYFKDKKAYSQIDGNLFTGVAKAGIDEIKELRTFKNGEVIRIKRIENRFLKKDVSFDKYKGMEGYFYFDDDFMIYEGEIKNSLFTGKVEEIKELGVRTGEYSTYVNGFLQGKSIQGGKEYIYNQGQLVERGNGVGKTKILEIPENAVSSNKVKFDGRKLEVDNYDNYSGYIFEDRYDIRTFIKVENNIIVEISEFYNCSVIAVSYGSYESCVDYSIYFPKEIIVFDENGSYSKTTYDRQGKLLEDIKVEGE